MAVAEDAVAASSRGAAGGLEAVGVASSHAAGLGAGVTREFSVLGAEVARGNFSRIPGSLIVLNERLVSTGTSVLTLSNFMKAFGGLASVIFNPYVIGFLGLTIGLDLLIKGFDKLVGSGTDLADVLKQQETQVNSLGDAYGNLAAQAEAAVSSTANRNAFGISSVASQAQLQIGIAKQTNDLLAQLQYLGGFDGNQTQVYEEFAPFSEAIQHLSDTAAKGAPDVLGFKKMVEEKWALDPTNTALSKAASEIEDLVTKADGSAPSLEALAEGLKKVQTVASQIFNVQGGHPGFDVGTNMIANMVSAGNAAAEALKHVEDSAGTQGLTAYARAIANINREFDQAIVKAHASGAALDTFNQARNLSIQEAATKALSDVSFDQPIAGANALGAAITSVGSAAAGVKVELGGMAAPIVNITELFGRAKLDQLIGLESATKQFEDMKLKVIDINNQLDILSHKDPAAIFGNSGSGTGADLTNAYNQIKAVFDLWDTGNASVRDVHDRIEEVRASLIALGGDQAGVNQFIANIVDGMMKVRQLNSDVKTLGHSIASLPNKTVTITIKTQRIGSGTQSLYDVPNGSGGTSQVGVTRYGGDGSTSGPSITSNEVPRTSGYGSMGGSGDLGSTTVNVTRFATGGMIHPGDTQQVSFFKSPDETVGIFTPGQMQALADPQSGFTGTQPTANDNRAWTVLMNVEANTKKTAQILDDIKTASLSASSSLSSSYGGSSGGVDTSQQDQLSAQYAQVLKQIRSNFAAAGIVGRGIIGYGLDNLAASPEQIARNIVYGGSSPIGFASGGMIAPGDSQEVRFFKSPEETVAIFTPQQVSALQGANQNQQTTRSADQRPITFQMPITVQGGGQVSNDSIAEMKRQFALALREGLRSINGR
jgi:hypothetical protein